MMASPLLFASRRKPKRVGREPGHAPDEGDDDDDGPVVRKPTSSTPRIKSKLHLSFNPAEAVTAEEHGQSETISKKRPAASDRAQSLLRQSEAALQTADRPTYSKDYLSELRQSTPTTPKDLSAYTSSAEDDSALDIVSKFGAQPTISHIPSSVEIEEKKQRRARRAKEVGSEDFIALEDYDSDGEFKPQRMQMSKPLDTSIEKNTRLVRDDEDMAEGFESFVDDPGKVTLSRKAKREQERKEKENMRSMIAEAEDSSDESDSSAERNYAYETAQTSHGMDGLSLKQKQSQSRRLQQPKEITPIPKLAAVLARFREGIQGLEYKRARLQKRQADIEKEKAEIATREDNIQRLLIETGERFERLRGKAEEPVNGHDPERRSRSLGGTPGP